MCEAAYEFDDERPTMVGHPPYPVPKKCEYCGGSPEIAEGDRFIEWCSECIDDCGAHTGQKIDRCGYCSSENVVLYDMDGDECCWDCALIMLHSKD